LLYSVLILLLIIFFFIVSSFLLSCRPTNPYFFHLFIDLLEAVGGATGGSRRLLLDELHRRRDPNNPHFSTCSLHQFTSFFSRRFVSIVIKPHEVKNHRNIKHPKHWKLKPKTSFFIIVAKIFRSGAH